MSQTYKPHEELLHSLTHAIGAGMAIVGLVLLVADAAEQGDPWKVVSFSIYGSTLVLLYLASSLYHGTSFPKLKSVFQYLDHSAIYLLIAGTYTPFTLVTIRGPWGWTLFGLIWTLAIFGIVLETIAFNKLMLLKVGIYLFMGWLAVVAIYPIWLNLSAYGMMWIAIGGLCYSLGVIFYVVKRIPYNHVIWHGFVIGGSVSHFLGIYWHVLPKA